MDTALSPWRKIRYRLEWFGVLLMARLIPLLSRKVLLRLSRALGWISYHADKRGRTTAIQNLEAVFGDEKTPDEIRAIALRSYQSFARTTCDHFWTPRLNRENFKTYCHYDVQDEASILAARETGSIWVTPHYGNFEWLALCMGFFDFPLCIVMQDFKNPLLTKFFTKNRASSGHTVVPRDNVVARLLQVLKKGQNVALLCDLTVPPSRSATIIDCMGFKTCVTPLHAEFARCRKLPIFGGLCIPRDDGNYDIKNFPALEIDPGDTTAEIAQKCWDLFEPHIRAQPEHWLWMYKHWRFRPAHGGEKYPPYSNPTDVIEKLIAANERAANSR